MHFTSKNQAGDGYQGNDRDVSDSMFDFLWAPTVRLSARLLCYASLVGGMDLMFVPDVATCPGSGESGFELCLPKPVFSSSISVDSHL